MYTEIRTFLLHAILILACVSNCTSFEERQKKAIEVVLQEDYKLMQSAQEKIKNKGNKIDAFTTYTFQMKTINLENCPADFSEIFRKHTYAWEDAVKQMKEKDNDFLGNLFEGIIGFATGNTKLTMSALTKILGDNGVDMQQVNNSWRDVELSARKYKAKLPVGPN
jgi:hypothetical protein